MPGSVANAVVAGVLPWNLCRAFSRSQEIPIALNEYRNGEAQTLALADTPRLSWRLSHRLTSATMATLLAFYQARLGTVQCFRFYDVFDTVGFAYDPTGESPVGRYLVRFDCPWEHTMGIARGDVSFSLIQVA